jgi:hypothetical protein
VDPTPKDYATTGGESLGHTFIRIHCFLFGFFGFVPPPPPPPPQTNSWDGEYCGSTNPLLPVLASLFVCLFVFFPGYFDGKCALCQLGSG